MLFKSSFEFLHEAIRGFKSFVSGCGCGNYQKLPKHSPLPPRESARVCEGFSETPPAPSSRFEVQRSPGDNGRRKTANSGTYDGLNCNRLGSNGGGRSCVVTRKLKELEALDLGNIQHVLDVEEAIHYYSLLKNPVYRAIVDEFFAGIYVEFLGDSDHNVGRPLRIKLTMRELPKLSKGRGNGEGGGSPPRNPVVLWALDTSRHSVPSREDSIIGVVGFPT